MCDQDQLAAMDQSASINRRQFGALAGSLAGTGALAACAPIPASSDTVAGLNQRDVSFAAPGGTMDGVFIHPASGTHPAIILWPDIAGLRPAKIEMGRRLAAQGYAVLVANPYYRSVAGQQFADFAAFRDNDGFNAVRPWIALNTPAAVRETARAVVTWLDAQGAVDSARGIGNHGHCMTGSWTIYTAAAVPARVKAAGSFHGGGLTGDAPTAPVNLLDDCAADAHILIAISQDDDARDTAAKDLLAAAGAAAAADVVVEVYPANHGWTVLDSPVYDEAQAARAMAALLGIYAQL